MLPHGPRETNEHLDGMLHIVKPSVMPFFSIISRFIVSLFSLYPPEILQSPMNAHNVWHSLLDLSPPLRDYLLRFDTHYSYIGLICGPDDWFVSCVEAYKRDADGVRHELLFITAKRTPRLPSVPTDDPPLEDDQADDLMDACLIIEHVENNEAGKGKCMSRDSGSPKNDEECKNEGNGSYVSLWDSFPNTTVKWVWGGRTARDTPRLVKYKKRALRGYDKLGYMEFPTPPVLPPDNDFRAALNALENPPAQPAPESSRFISLPTLISLASFISEKYPVYTPTDTNCYWFCAVIIQMLRKYTRVDFFLVTKNGNVRIGPQELHAAIDDKVKQTRAIGSCSFLTITGAPDDERVIAEGEEWEVQEEMRMKKLQDVRYTKLTKMKAAEDELKALKDWADDATRYLAERDKVIAERDKAIAERDNMIAERDKAIAEDRQKADAEDAIRMKDAEDELKALKDRADADRQRAEDAIREIAEIRRQLDALKVNH